MIFIDYTGKGWLTYALVPVVLFVGVVVGLSLDGGSGPKYLGAGLAAVIIGVGGGVTQWVLGRAVNGDTAEHTTYGIPMERTAPFYPTMGLVMLAFVVGQATSPLWGIALLVCAAVPAWWLVRAVRRRRRSA